MRIIPLDLVRRGVAGLRSVSDEADELLRALEDLATDRVIVVHERGDALGPAEAREAVERCGSVAGAARALGVPRSTLRDLVSRAS